MYANSFKKLISHNLRSQLLKYLGWNIRADIMNTLIKREGLHNKVRHPTGGTPGTSWSAS